jgi:hypothetical protein
MHISSVDEQGDLQGASINCGKEDLLSVSSPSLTLMFSSSQLTLSNSKNIAPSSAYTKVVIMINEDGIELIAIFFIPLSFIII